MTRLARPALPRPSLWLAGAIGALAVLAIPLGALLAQERAIRCTVIESGQGFERLQQAVDAIGDERGTIAIAPGRHADCAVKTASIVSYLVSEPGTAVVADWSGDALALSESALGPGLTGFEKR